ncbi:MAG: S9 family peptidase [bacterium]|nr:S9 family peptidase [bacterium]
MALDAGRARLIAVRENHEVDSEAVNEIVAVSLTGGAVEVLAGGNDFVSTPVLSPGGHRLAWLTWDHPNMPWDGTELWVADLNADGKLDSPRRVAGGDDVSVFQPAWSPSGELWFAADPEGWWNLHCWDGSGAKCMLEMQAEFGRPQWVFGMSAYGFAGDGSVVCAYCERGEWRAGRLDPVSGTFHRLGLQLSGIEEVAVEGENAALLGGSARAATSVIRFHLGTGAKEVLRASISISIDAGYLSEAERLEFPTRNGETAHAFFYPPRNKDFSGPEDERPPLIVIGHGGPTAATSTSLALKIQFWTSRGFAVLDVNYRGSTGYGRAYRERLKGDWGIADVEDCVHGALYLAGQGLVDRNRLAIRGGSAGGYLALAALAFHDVFSAGASYYGVGDLEALATDTHKFESRYLDSLIGPYPDHADVYRARSPIHHVDRLSAPVIFFQGLDDKVVPPNQAETMVAALEEKGILVAYFAFEGEQHGFRKEETLRRTLTEELAFYGKVFGFEPAVR